MATSRLLANRYELGDMLGYGSMSEVHHGHDVRLGREVAIKILRADLARDPHFQERFRREVQNAAALNHPAIVAVYDTGEMQADFGPLPYIVMEFVEGRTLRDIVKTKGPMSQNRAMEIMADVCAALDFSHRHGIVHRNVKPANVMITKNGAVKVMDFAMHDGQSAMTQTDVVIGTAQYLSPEQARGEALDARSDVYAAGCVLYELITGVPPFIGDSPVAVAYQHVRETPRPPNLVNSSISNELNTVVLTSLAKGLTSRYQSCAEMRADIVQVLAPPVFRQFKVNKFVEKYLVSKQRGNFVTARNDTQYKMKDLDVLRLTATMQYREEPNGQSVYTFDNSGSLSTAIETIRVTHSAKVEVAVQIDKTKVAGGGTAIGFLNVARMEGRIQNEILVKHSLDLKKDLVFEQTTAIDIPPSTNVRVIFRWIRLWEEGVATLGTRAENLAEVPYSVTTGIRFDKKTSDIPTRPHS